MLGAEGEVLGADDVPAVGGDTGDGPAVLGVLLRPVREDLPGADRVELLDAVEEEQPDVTRACGARAEVGCLGSDVGLGDRLAEQVETTGLLSITGLVGLAPAEAPGSARPNGPAVRSTGAGRPRA